MTTNLQVVQKDQSAVARPAPTVGEMLSAVIEKGVTTENVSAIEKLVGLYERMKERDAEKEFASAFVELQAEMKNVQASQAVPGRDGSVRYRFADYQSIMDQVAPLLKKHGFTVTFSTDFRENRIIKTCILQHTGGHKRENSFAVRIGAGPPGCTDSQADGAASTYAKRYALCDALNIVTMDVEDDARAEGGPITLEQAKSLRERVKATASDEKAFLKFAGAATYEEILASKYDLLDASLKRKESTK